MGTLLVVITGVLAIAAVVCLFKCNTYERGDDDGKFDPM